MSAPGTNLLFFLKKKPKTFPLFLNMPIIHVLNKAGQKNLWYVLSEHSHPSKPKSPQEAITSLKTLRGLKFQTVGVLINIVI